MEKALLSRIQLMEIQAMDTETYVDTMENLGTYLEKLISQLKGCNGQELSDKLLDNLQDYDWEGNKTLRSKELKGGGRIRRKAFEDIGYEMIRNCWKVSGQNADKLLATIKEMLKTFTEALEAKNKGSIYTEAELNILGAFDEGLTAQKNATSEQRSLMEAISQCILLLRMRTRKQRCRESAIRYIRLTG